MKDAIMVVDFGMSKIHSCLVCLTDGSLLSEDEVSYEWDVMANNRAEIHPEKLFVASEKAVRLLLDHYDSDQIDIRALAFSYFGDNFVCMDENGHALTPLIAPTDLRATAEAEEMMKTVGNETFSQMTGTIIHSDIVAPKILWVKRHEPEIFAKTKLIGSLEQYILVRLGFPPMNDPSMASTLTLANTRSGKWEPDLLSASGASEEQLGEIVDATLYVGEIACYGDTKLPHCLPVVLGAHDAVCGAIGLGLIPDGGFNGIGHLSGTYNLMCLETGRFVNTYHEFENKISGWTECGPSIGCFHLQVGDQIGPPLKWFVREFFSKEKGALGALSAMARYDGSCTVRQKHDPLFGNCCFEGLSVTHTVVDLFTAMMENNTFRLRSMMDIYEKINRKPFECVRIGAGGAVADNLNQFKADMFATRVETVKNLQASSVGVAIIAAVGIHYYPDYVQAIRNMVHVDKVYLPNPEISGIYQERFKSYVFDKEF